MPLRKLIAVGRRRRVLTPLVGAAALAAVAIAALDLTAGAEGTSARAGAEVSLNDLPAPERRSLDENLRQRGNPTPVQIVGAKGARGEDLGEEAPPDRVVRENSRLRRDLEDLRAIEAEQREVSRALGSAAAAYDGPLRLGAGGLAWPVSGSFTSPFGMRWGRLHAGIDIAAPEGTPIRAAESGRVVLAGWQGGYGNYTCIQHTRVLSTCYAHQSRLGTRTGRKVRQGQVMGFVGNTGHSFGAHLHFETRVRGRPVDPKRFL